MRHKQLEVKDRSLNLPFDKLSGDYSATITNYNIIRFSNQTSSNFSRDILPIVRRVFASENTKLRTRAERAATSRLTQMQPILTGTKWGSIPVPICETIDHPPVAVQDFRIANRPRITFGARANYPGVATWTVPDKDCKNSPNRSHSPLVMKLLMSPPVSSCSCRSNCRQFMTVD